jgi:hypothetical protein
MQREQRKKEREQQKAARQQRRLNCRDEGRRQGLRGPGLQDFVKKCAAG